MFKAAMFQLLQAGRSKCNMPQGAGLAQQGFATAAGMCARPAQHAHSGADAVAHRQTWSSMRSQPCRFSTSRRGLHDTPERVLHCVHRAGKSFALTWALVERILMAPLSYA